MSDPSLHVIRLRGFWTVTVINPGLVRHSRAFGQPRTIDPHETIWIVGSRSPGNGTILLNDQLLGSLEANSPFRFEITGLLRPRNQMAIEVWAEPSELLGDIALEIRNRGPEIAPGGN